jgi:sugar/nucleoside kinase (ribokinase family)
MPDVACLGLLVADTVGRPIDALPTRGTLELIERIELHTGGNAANTGVALAKLGMSTAVLGKVGRDGFGDFMVGSLAGHGVDVRGVARDDAAPTAATLVMVHSDAERTFLHVAGANATLTEDDVAWDVTDGARLFYVAGLQLLSALEGDGVAAVLAQARRRGMTTVLDTVMNPRSRGWDGLAPALPHLDWAIPSFEEARALTGEAKALRQARKLQAAGARNVAVKMGANGCLVVPEGAEPFHVAPFRVEAVDALGAGDAWAAGFLTGLLHDWPLERTARFANAVGACCVQALGATTGVRSLVETVTLMETLPLDTRFAAPPADLENA